MKTYMLLGVQSVPVYAEIEVDSLEDAVKQARGEVDWIRNEDCCNPKAAELQEVLDEEGASVYVRDDGL